MRYSYVKWKNIDAPWRVCDDKEELIIAGCELEEEAKLITLALNYLHDQPVRFTKEFKARMSPRNPGEGDT